MKTGAHEVVITIMMNGIAISLLAWAIRGPLRFSSTVRTGQNVDVRPTTSRTARWSPIWARSSGFGPGAHLSWLLFLAIGAAVIVWFLLRRTRLGYEARAVGSAQGSARAGGISIGSTQIRLFLISGALAGLVGMQQILATTGISARTTWRYWGSRGSRWRSSAQNNPIGIIFAAILWGVLARGETALQIETQVPREFIIILQGILIMSVVITYQVAKRRLAARQLQRAGAAGALEDSAAETDRRGHGQGGSLTMPLTDIASRCRSRSRTSRSST